MSKRKRKLRGTVLKVLKPIGPGEPEKAEISIEEADDLYREVRVENVLTDDHCRPGWNALHSFPRVNCSVLLQLSPVRAAHSFWAKRA